MAQYRYKALNNKGRMLSGVMSAGNEIDLETRLKVTGLDLTDYTELTSKRSRGANKISTKELILLCVQLGQLEKAGVPILEALDDLRDSADTLKMKNLMTEINEEVRGGHMLSAALAAHPAIFDEVFVGLIKAGEKTGQLYQVFFHLATHLRWVHEIHSKIVQSTRYPIFLLLLMGGVISLMMMYVVPKLTSFLLSQNIELPIYTKALIQTSLIFQNYWYLFFTAPILIFATLRILINSSQDIAFMYDNLKLQLPFFGKVIRKIEMARFCRFFSITFVSGIGVLECLDVASNIVKNKVIKEAIEDARKKVSEGVSLTNSLRSTNHFPVLVLRMFKVGEDSGGLSEALENVNQFYDKEVDDAVSAAIGLIQPTLTILMGMIMLWISMSVFGPLYNSFSKMNF